MSKPYNKKLRDLRRKFKSGQRPHPWKLFSRYSPLSDRDLNGDIDWAKWDIPGFIKLSSNAESFWVNHVCGHKLHEVPAPPSWFRRQLNRLLRAQQKSAFRQALRDDNWEIPIPDHIRNCRYLWY